MYISLSLYIYIHLTGTCHAAFTRARQLGGYAQTDFHIFNNRCVYYD